MEFRVRLFADGKRVELAQYKEIVITSKAIDLIVNRVYGLANEGDDLTTDEAPSP